MNHRYFTFLFIGFILALVIFGFNTPLLPEFKINYSMATSWPEFLTAIGTFATGIIAVVLALWGKVINEYLFKPDMRLIDHHENEQAGDPHVQGHTRLKFINMGKSLARNVNVYIDDINDGGILRGHFLPVPLSWTHDGRYFRNFPPNEVWFLDLCRKDNIANNQFPILVLAAGQGVSNYQALYPGKTLLTLRVSDESGGIKKYKVELFWKIREPYVKVQRITEVSVYFNK